MTNKEDRQQISNSRLASIEDIEEALASLPPMRIGFLGAISDWKERHEAGVEARRSEIAAASAKQAKLEYHAEHPGARYNKKHNHEPQDAMGGEIIGAYNKRLHRDRQRSYRGVTEDTVAARQPATPERRAEQLRVAQVVQRTKKTTAEQSAERKERRKRAKERLAAEAIARMAARAIV